ncbi:MAG: amidohydrolase family protein [Gemmatimonadota bacterium]
MRPTIAGLAFVPLLLLAASPGTAAAQDAADASAGQDTASESGATPNRPPILDMHMHAFAVDAMGPPPLAICAPFEEWPVWDQRQPYGATFMGVSKEPTCENPVWSPETDGELMRQTIEVMERRNIVGVLSGAAEMVAKWREAAPGRFIPSLGFTVATDTVFSGAVEGPISPDSLRSLVESGQVEVLGEVINQYAGIAPDDERMEPYWALAEELDIPVGIHIGPGPPGVHYLNAPGYRARMHSPFTLEEVLVDHPKLRVYVMHAGFPMIDDMLAMLYTHPQLYVDISVIAYTQPKKGFYRYLERIVEAGFTDRVMWGSDQMVWPGVIEHSIRTIEDAPFLDEAQKRAILYDNAARFLRLSEEEMARHREM